MGFSSGASSAKRKARKAAAEQYYKAFKKLEAIPDVGNLETNNKREIEEKLGNNASFRTRNLAQKADRAAREFRNDDEYKANVAAYNDRYAILKDQIANKGSVRYSVTNRPAAIKPDNLNGLLGFNNNWNILNQQQTGMASMINNASFDRFNPQGEYITAQKNGGLYNTKEEAMGAAKKRMEEFNAGIKPAGVTAFYNNNLERQATDPNQFIQETKFQPFGVLYRNLPVAERAADDLTKLSKKVIGTQGNKALEQYLSIAERLRPMLKRDANNPLVINEGQSMVAGELAQAAPYTETIK